MFKGRSSRRKVLDKGYGYKRTALRPNVYKNQMDINIKNWLDRLTAGLLVLQLSRRLYAFINIFMAQQGGIYAAFRSLIRICHASCVRCNYRPFV